MAFRINMNRKRQLVSILIVNYNGGDILGSCLDSLKKTSHSNFETIVVDNGSTDGSVEMVKKKYKWVKLVEAKENLGFASGNNLALRQAQGEYIVLLNGDTEVEQDWLERLVGFAGEHKDGGVFTPKVLFFDDKKVINSAGGLCDIFGFSPLRGTFEKDEGQYDNPETVFYAHGAAMMIRKKLIDEIGFLDDSYFIYHEEMDFCWRTWLYGYKVYYVPQAIVYHKLKKRLFYSKEKLARRQFLVKKNRVRTIVKNHKNPFLILLSLFSNMVISLGEITYYLIKGDFESPKGILEGYWWNIKVLSDTLEERKRIQKFYRVSEEEVLNKINKVPFVFEILFGMLKGKYSLPL